MTWGRWQPRRPADLNALRPMVKDAAKNGRQVRVRGATHAGASAIYADGDRKTSNKILQSRPARGGEKQLNLELNAPEFRQLGPPQQQRDPISGNLVTTVKVGAGIHLGQEATIPDATEANSFLGQLDKHKLTLAHLGGITHQTVAGFIATASSGGSTRYAFGEALFSVELVRADGTVVEVGRDHPAFPAMLGNLGLFGVVTAATFECVPRFRVAGSETATAVDKCGIDLFGDGTGDPTLDEWLATEEFARIEWWPQRRAERVVVWKAARVTPNARMATSTPEPYYRFEGGQPTYQQSLVTLVLTVLGNLSKGMRARRTLQAVARQAKEKQIPLPWWFALLAWLLVQVVCTLDRYCCGVVTRYVPRFYHRLLNVFVPLGKRPRTFNDDSWKTLPMDNQVCDLLIPAAFTEFFVPLHRATELMRVMRDYFGVKDIHQSYKRTGLFTYEIYAAKASRSWLSPAYSNGADEWKDGAFRLNAYWFGNNHGKPEEGFFHDMWEHVREAGIEFRLHWGKYQPDYAVGDRYWVDFFRAQYPHWEDFLAQRAQFDPAGVFLNRYWRDRFALWEPASPKSERERLSRSVMADLHCHYPLHVVSDVSPRSTAVIMGRVIGQPTVYDGSRALILKLAARLLNHSQFFSGYRVSAPALRDGNVGLAMSVLYRPFEEMDLKRQYGSAPLAGYFTHLLHDLQAVEVQVAAAEDPSQIRIVHNLEELDACLDAGATALVHCVEGGFHVGGSGSDIEENVGILAERGVAYITVAHLFSRQVAANAPAIPFLPDRIYDCLFPQRDPYPITARGRLLIEAMVKHRIVVDLSHMRQDAIHEALDMLDRYDPKRTLPVMSTHAGFRFDGKAYMHDAETIKRIAERDGVIGLILAQHQLNHGLRKTRTRSLKASMKVIRAHIDAIHDITGDYRHVAIGSDMDGFIKPTMGGIETMRDMRPLQAAIKETYLGHGDLILWDNALRVLRKAWSP